jgi:uncharacterized protein GlcG (DUF336 family)
MALPGKKAKSRVLHFEGLESRVALSAAPVITPSDVQLLLERASAASASQDAIIAIVDRGGHILGVRTEGKVNISDPGYLTFAIDGAVAEARSGAFFSSNQAPLTSRTVRFISQSTITEREVNANPNSSDPTIQGPGYVAPIGVGGQFPPGITSTPLVDLFAIEHTNRVELGLPPGPGGVSVTEQESYGVQSGILPNAQSRGIATLPGGIPLFKNNVLVGGIGVFFPGPKGYASYEQGFVPKIGQTSLQRTNAPRVEEAEWIAFAATGGSSGANAVVGPLGGIPRVPGYDFPGGPKTRIDLAGITLQEIGPTAGPLGIQAILKVGNSVGRGYATGHGNTDQPINLAHTVFYGMGTTVPDGWLVQPHAGSALTQAQVTQIINQGIQQANATRAQIRPLGNATKMVLAVADKDGSLLGVYRMPDATVFSIDVAIAKSRNTVYYANPAFLQPGDEVDDNRDGHSDIPVGAALTNRTFRFLAAPNYPSGALNSVPGSFSILRDPGINPKTGENTGAPQPASVYQSVLGFDSFHPGRNFREPFSDSPASNQNGVVFFPGSSALYTHNVLVGGFGVSGDGVNQDDVVTFYGLQGYVAPDGIEADKFSVRNVRLPYQNFSRNATQL